MTIRKLTSVAVASFALLMAACGGGSDNPTPAPTTPRPTPTPTPSPSPTPTPTPTPAPPPPVVLKTERAFTNLTFAAALSLLRAQDPSAEGSHVVSAAHSAPAALS